MGKHGMECGHKEIPLAERELELRAIRCAVPSPLYSGERGWGEGVRIPSGISENCANSVSSPPRPPPPSCSHSGNFTPSEKFIGRGPALASPRELTPQPSL